MPPLALLCGRPWAQSPNCFDHFKSGQIQPQNNHLATFINRQSKSLQKIGRSIKMQPQTECGNLLTQEKKFEVNFMLQFFNQLNFRFSFGFKGVSTSKSSLFKKKYEFVFETD